MLCVNGGLPLCALRAPLPSLGSLGAVGHVLPLEGALPPQSWGLCAWNPASSVPARPVGHLPSASGSSGFASQDGGGRPFLLGWTVHMLIAQTRRHIFIIVIKLYCTKVLGQYLWEREGGMGIEDRGWDKLRWWECGLQFGWVEGLWG